MSNNTVVYIAEKPDIATAMAAFLWPDYKGYKMAHAYRKGDVVVTWAFGHILMTAMPEAYGNDYRDFSRYPIFPEKWKKLPSPSAREQLEYIKGVLKEADTVVNAGDPDREGQLLVDEILEYFNYKGIVKRILINAKDQNSLRRAFDNIVPNEKFRNLYYAGLGRERADWLVGINLSRAYTVSSRKEGKGTLWRVGRVKVPTLALVVKREKEIQDFHSVEYYELIGNYSKGGVPFTATLKVSEDASIDAEGHVIDKNYLKSIQDEVKNLPARVSLCEKKMQIENAPLPYSLDTLQVEANKRYGFSPSKVLATVQSLYEMKYVSYPRSDCNFIPESQMSDGLRIMKSLGKYGIESAFRADPSLKSRCFNSSKVSAHHAIIPTGVVPEKLDDTEKKIYDMIALRYIIQFYPSCKYNTIKYELSSKGHVFAGSGKAVTSPGWRTVIKEDREDETRQIPDLQVGDVISLPVYTIDTKKTTPPKRFTEGTLLAAMTNIWRFVSPDNPNRDKLKECKGIGTPATRDTIISELMSDKSGKVSILPCIRKSGKELVPTPFGISMVENIHESLTKPDMTALMEYNLSSISEGRMSLSDFLSQTVKMVLDNIKFAENSASALSAFKQNNDNEVPSVECPVCHQRTLTRRYSAKTKKHFWVCSDQSCVHPSTGKSIFYIDNRKKPLIKMCPQCGMPLTGGYSKKTKDLYWFCPKCNEFKKMK